MGEREVGFGELMASSDGSMTVEGLMQRFSIRFRAPPPGFSLLTFSEGSERSSIDVYVTRHRAVCTVTEGSCKSEGEAAAAAAAAAAALL